MEKKTVKAVTRKQKYLAAIAGDGVAPNPITSDEKLMYNIAEKTNEGGGSSGGVLVVNIGSQGELNASYNELDSAIKSGKIVMFYGGDETYSAAFHLSSIGIDDREGIYYATFVNYGIGGAEFMSFSANDASTKPMTHYNG